jgi:hypothetical protein
VDNGRTLVPRHELVVDQATRWQEWQVVATSADETAIVAFLPRGGTLALDLRDISHPLAVTWYDPLTGAYRSQSSVDGGAVQTFASPFGAAMAVLRLDVVN